MVDISGLLEQGTSTNWGDIMVLPTTHPQRLYTMDDACVICKLQCPGVPVMPPDCDEHAYLSWPGLVSSVNTCIQPYSKTPYTYKPMQLWQPLPPYALQMCQHVCTMVFTAAMLNMLHNINSFHHPQRMPTFGLPYWRLSSNFDMQRTGQRPTY